MFQGLQNAPTNLQQVNFFRATPTIKFKEEAGVVNALKKRLKKLNTSK